MKPKSSNRNSKEDRNGNSNGNIKENIIDIRQGSYSGNGKENKRSPDFSPRLENPEVRKEIIAEDRKRMGNVIRKYRAAAHLEQSELGALLGYSATGVGSWEVGKSSPSIQSLPALCTALRIPIHELLGADIATVSPLSAADEQLLNSFHAMHMDNQKLIRQLINQILNDQEQAKGQYLRQTTGSLTRVDELSPAAGFGVPALDNVDTETVYMRRSWAFDHSDLITRVSGDSMHPLYPDGCLIFVNRQEETPLGEVGIFLVDGQYFIKERREDGLYSLNTKRPNILYTDDMDIRHYGCVMGRVDERDFLSGDDLDEVRAAWEMMEE